MVILTRDVVASTLQKVVIAVVTRRVRGIASEVSVGPREGVPYPSVINCDNVLTIPRDALDPEPIGTLGSVKRQQLDRALRYSLAIKT